MSTPDDREKAGAKGTAATFVERLRARAGTRRREPLLVSFAAHVEQTGEPYPNWPEAIPEHAEEHAGAHAGAGDAGGADAAAGAPPGRPETAERRRPEVEGAPDGEPGPAPAAPAEALADGLSRTLAIAYAEPGQSLSEHRIEVRGIFRRAGAVYLRAFCNLAQAERDFRLDRIIELADLDTGEAPGDPRAFVMERLLARGG